MEDGIEEKDLPDDLKKADHVGDDPEKMLLNGGSSIIGPDGKYVEVQIRSDRMDQIAERGFAASLQPEHWHTI